MAVTVRELEKIGREGLKALKDKLGVDCIRLIPSLKKNRKKKFGKI